MPLMKSPKKTTASPEQATDQAASVPTEMNRSASESEFEGYGPPNTSAIPLPAGLGDGRNVRMRKHFEQKLNRIEQALKEATITDAALLKGCQTRLSMLSAEYETWHINSLASSSTAEFEREEEEYGLFERRHFELSLIVERSMASNVVPMQATTTHTKLPEMRLPVFNGKMEDWLPFRDAFVSLIDSNKNLSDVDKLRYLKGSLQKDALNAVGDIEITDANYSVAWEILKARFDNKKLVVKRYLDGLFAIPQMKKESYDSLIALIDGFERGVKMTTKMGVATEGWSELLAHMVCAKLDVATLKQWENHHRSTDVPKYDEVMQFLRSHATVLQAMMPAKTRLSETSSTEGRSMNRNEVYSVVQPYSKGCPFCKKASHSAYQCDVFRKATVDKRQDLARKEQVCFNCLSAGHQRKNCSSGACRVCQRNHHTMLHKPTSSHEPSVPSPTTGLSSSSEEAAMPASVVQHCARNVKEKTILLPTAMVKIVNAEGTHIWARALLDGGSQINIITERLVQRLRVPKKNEHHRLGGIGMAQHTSQHSVHIAIHSHCTTFKASWKFHVLKEVTWDQPSHAVDPEGLNLPKGVTLADPHFYEPGPIDLLIGREGYNDLLLGNIMRLNNPKLLLQNTELGWIVSGEVSQSLTNSSVALHVMTLEDQLSRFWELETCHSPGTWSVDEAECEAEFIQTTERDHEGRFVVALPKQPDKLNQLGDSYEIAVRRLQSLRRRLSSNAELNKEYVNFLKEYLELGHMKEILPDHRETVKSYYMPHHCVIRPDSMTTKLRVVFDASCATDTGVSLNDALRIGPSVQEDLFSLLLRFRVPRFAILADIEKMYRQIWVKESDQPLQRILWKEPNEDRTRIYQLKTVTYGTACAPYLATRCLQALAKEGEPFYPKASKILAQDFYMDDLITGVDSVEDGQILCKEINQLLTSAGFRLRKWASNSADLLKHIPVELQNDCDVLNIDPGTSIKALGLRWMPSSDQLGFSVPSWKETDVITKRIALSDAAKLFDPLGLLGPVIVVAKCFMQQLWKNEKTWDEPLDAEGQQFWRHFRDQLAHLDSLSIPRRAIGSIVRIEAHGFSDASQKAYGACIYLRAESSEGNVEVRLLCAKSKVAPIPNTNRKKNVTLPRLELSGALLLSHLWQKVKQGLKLELNIDFWVDSTIVLHWISSNPSRWKQFIANRVAEIQHQTYKMKWRYVASEHNPADIISRGMMPVQLKDASIWWNGPSWLHLPSCDWPTNQPATEFAAEELEERSIVASSQRVPSNFLFGLSSSYNKLVRLTAYIKRFIYNCQPTHRANLRKGLLQTDELVAASLTLVRLAQQETFAEELRDIRQTGTVKPHSKLTTLTPILENDILRVGGRLRNAPVSYTRKYPIILAYSHPLTLLIARYYHQKYLHAGQQQLISSIREKYWPLRIRNLARKVVHECVSCFRTKPTTAEQFMGDLPIERVTPTLPFYNSGVDLCGPLFYKPNSKKAAPIKCYVAVFVCLVTKAVHVELIADLSTPAFISTLKRFIARRGKPSIIECDNGKNFRGADRALQEMRELFQKQQLKEAVANFCGSEGITFKFIPPRSPHFGGLWEAAVKSLKRHLKTTLGSSVLRRDDLETILVQVEACMNSRPLTALSNDPEDLEILTPGHFLIHRALISLPEPSYAEIPENRLDRYQQNQEYVRRIWKRWMTDYLSGLQPRTRWSAKRNNIREGTMVLVKEENLPPMKWRFGRVLKVFAGDDGLIRVVDVKTKDGTYRRAIAKICILPGQGEKDLE